MKKLTALLLALLLLLPCLAWAEEAAPETVFHPGDTFEASFDLLSNPKNATFIMAHLSFDSSVFEPLTSQAITFANNNYGVTLQVDGSHLESFLGSIPIKIKDQARPGTFVIKLNIISAVDKDNEIIPDPQSNIEVSPLTITVRLREGEKRVYHPGDTVEAYFTVTDNPGKAMTAIMQLDYSHTVFEPIASNVVRDDMISFVDKTGVIPVGVQQAVSFRILPTAADGSYTISMKISNARTENNDIVLDPDFKVSSVQVEVEKSETQKALEDARAEIARLQEQLEALAQEKQSVDSDLETANAELEAAQKNNEDVSLQLADAKVQAEADAETIKNLKTQLEDLRQQLEEWKNKPILGDFNGKDGVNLADLVILNSYLETGVTDIEDITVFDFNQDEIVDLRDSHALEYYLNLNSRTENPNDEGN